MASCSQKPSFWNKRDAKICEAIANQAQSMADISLLFCPVIELFEHAARVTR